MLRRALRRIPGVSEGYYWAKGRRGTIRLQEAVQDSQLPKIHVGSGGTELSGWINTDLYGDLHLDVLRPWPVPAGSIAYVFADNVIEHFSLEGARVFLARVFESLEAGGKVRLATPDAGRAARAYLDDRAAAEVLERHRRAGFDVPHRVEVLRKVFVEHGHHLGYIYDYEALAQELQSAGFVDVEQCEPCCSDDPQLRGLELRCSPSDSLWNVSIEGTKPHRHS